MLIARLSVLATGLNGPIWEMQHGREHVTGVEWLAVFS